MAEAKSEDPGLPKAAWFWIGVASMFLLYIFGDICYASGLRAAAQPCKCVSCHK